MGEEYIGTAIESVLEQTFDSFELLVIDDNSTDGTAAVVSRYGDSRIRFLRNSRNLGPEGNWNHCLAEARGQYVKLLPQDDLLAPDCLAQQVSVLEADAEQRIALVFCSRTIIDSRGRSIMTRRYPQRLGGQISSRSVVQACIYRGTNLIGEPGGVMFRKRLSDEVGGFDGAIGYVIDLDYWFRLLAQGDAYYLPEELVSFRVSSGSWSVAIGNRQYNDFRRFIAKITVTRTVKVSVAGIIAGNIMALANNLSRMFVYKILLKRGYVS